MSLPLEDTPISGPSPHDYQTPLADRTPLVGGRMHPLHQYTGQKLDWWELQRGPGKYGAPDKPHKNTHLGIIHPLPSTMSRIEDKTQPLPGSAHYSPKDVVGSVHGVPFGALSDERISGFGRDQNGSNVNVRAEGIPLLIPNFKHSSDIKKISGTRNGIMNRP